MRKLVQLAFFAATISDASAISVSISPQIPAFCTYATGSLTAYPQGGTPPYTYLWSNGGTDNIIENLTAGFYSVTVTDALSAQATADITLVAQNFDAWAGGLVGCPDGVLGPPFRIVGQAGLYYTGVEPQTPIDPNYQMWIAHGGETWEQANYMQSFNGWPAPGTELDVAFTDANGCPGTVHVTIPETPAYPNIQVLSVDAACTGGNNGSALVQVGTAPNVWPHYIHLIHEGTNIGLLEWQYNGSGMYGQQAQTTLRQDLAPGEYAAVVSARYPSNFEWLEPTFFTYVTANCGDSIWFTVPEMAGPCGTLNGNVYMDDNDDCIMWSSEVDVPQTVMSIEPGGYTAMTNSVGYYQANLPLGSYTVEQAPGDVGPSCTTAPIPLDLVSNGQWLTQNVADSALIARDVWIGMSSGPARPGFAMNYWLGVQHTTPGTTGTMTITLTFDPLLSYVSATPAPLAVTSNQVTWSLAQLTSFGFRSVGASFMVPANVGLIGTDLLASAAVGIVQPEPNTVNNSTTNTRTITGSFDPNAKEAVTSSGWSDELYYIDVDNWIDYTIQFQNTGTDTAFNVVITDTLPATLDPSTFILGARSHACIPQMTGQGVLRFLFPNILLPDSNSNEPASHGLVQFRIKPKEPLMPGTVIENIANIFFDFNPPVITEPSVLTAEFSTGVQEDIAVPNLFVFPNPTTNAITVGGMSADDRVVELRLSSVDGRLLRAERVTGTSPGLEVSDLSSGLYVLEVVLETEQRWTTTIMKP